MGGQRMNAMNRPRPVSWLSVMFLPWMFAASLEAGPIEAIVEGLPAGLPIAVEQVQSLYSSMPDALAKAEAANEIVRSRLQSLGLSFECVHTEYFGHSACHGINAPVPADPPEIQVRIGVRGKDRKAVDRFTRELIPLVPGSYTIEQASDYTLTYRLTDLADTRWVAVIAGVLGDEIEDSLLSLGQPAHLISHGGGSRTQPLEQAFVDIVPAQKAGVNLQCADPRRPSTDSRLADATKPPRDRADRQDASGRPGVRGAGRLLHVASGGLAA